jgi:peroxiredoxin Q/BCP
MWKVSFVMPMAFGKKKKKNGEKKFGIVRSTFIVDASGTIKFSEYGVSPKGHAEQILEVVRSF